jgi:hypothetical protein
MTLVVLIITMSIGTTTAHLEGDKTNSEVKMNYVSGNDHVFIKSSDNLTDSEGNLLSLADWESTYEDDDKNRYLLNFFLTNGESADDFYLLDEYATVSAVLTMGTANPDYVSVAITDGNETYIGQAEEIIDGSTLYSVYGEGWVYRFYNADGEEVSWYLHGGELSSQSLTMVVMGSVSEATELYLTASSSHSLANTSNSDSWAGQLNPVANTSSTQSEVSSDVLTEDGQTTVLLPSTGGNITIELSQDMPIIYDGAEIIPEGYVFRITSDDTEDWLTISTDCEDALTTLGIGFTVKPFKTSGDDGYFEYEDDPDDGIQYPTENESQPPSTEVTEDTPVTEQPNDTQENPVTDQTASEEESKSDFVTMELDGETADADESEEEIIQRTNPIIVTLEVLYNDGVTVETKLSAKVYIPVSDDDDDTVYSSGSLTYCQDFYSEGLPIYIETGENNTRLTYNGKDFPAMTKYTYDGKTCILGVGGTIDLPQNTVAAIYLSGDYMETDENENKILDFNIHVGETEYHPVNYVDLPVAETSIVVGIDGELTTVPYKLGSITASYYVEHLVQDEYGLTWKQSNAVTVQAGTYLNLTPANAQAGTYRLCVSYYDNYEREIYSLEIPFFVRYESADQGGTVQ